ncbi:MAG: ABC transporter permease [Blautia sp.]|nr:ABC transporter permease [Blautia sp.]
MKNNRFKTFISNNTIVPIMVIVLVFAAFVVPGFLNVGNIFNVFNQNAMKGIMAIGMTFLIINGYFDMSLCTLVGLTAALSCGLQESLGTVPAVLIALLAGAAVGLINGILVSYVGINAFVVTLAMMMGCHGIAYIYHKEQSFVARSEAFIHFGTGKIGPFSYISILFLLLLVIGHFVLRYTDYGRSTYAIGGNAAAAFNAGINTKLVTCMNFVVCGFLSGLGGVLYACYAGASTPALGWPDMHMLVIAAVVLGGTKLSGGSGNVWYTLGGIMLLGIIDNIMNLLNVQTYVSTMVNGLIMIGVLCLDKVMMAKQLKKANLEG